jgi:2'-5' RNA ligase
MTHRLFVALRPPREVRAQLLRLMGGVHHARWQSDEQLHLTVRFIGEVDRRMAEDVAAALGSVHDTAFPIALDGIGQFDRRGRIDALWAGVRPHDALARLHRKVDQALIRLGLPPAGRTYLPHVTLARFGSRAGPIDSFMALHGGLSSSAWQVNDFRLYESHLGHEGAAYECVARYPLATA